MRPTLALAILLLGLKAAVPESKIQDAAVAADAHRYSSSVEIDPSWGKADRVFALSVPSPEWLDDGHDQGENAVEAPQAPPPAGAHVAPAEADMGPAEADMGPAGADMGPAEADAAPAESASQSLDDLCATLLTSAESNDLPVPFFANLIWQESRLQNDAVSKVGALGIAQFMPQVASAVGVGDPFDPRQAIPASARILHALREHFGNLGFVAAAYNAGARRVGEWLDRGRALPRETRIYVARVTGQSVDQWRKAPLEDSKLTFVRRLPCRELPAFADMEQAQLEQAQLEQAASELAQAEPAQVEEAHASEPKQHKSQTARHTAAGAPRAKHRAADRRHRNAHIRPVTRVAAARSRPGKREAHYQRGRHEKHRTV